MGFLRSYIFSYQHKMTTQYLKYSTVLCICFALVSSSQAGPDPFAFFGTSVSISPNERAQLDRGNPFARALPTQGSEIAMVAAIPVNVSGDRLVAWERQVAQMKKEPSVLAVGRFSDPPRIEDLGSLELDNGDVAAIRACRPQNCEIKLAGAEMAQLKRAEAEAKSDPREAVQEAFRQIVLNRVQQYLATGQIPSDEDHRTTVQPSSRFAALLEHTPFLEDRVPELTAALRDFPSKPGPGVESVLYWSKEHLARKSMVSVTHESIVRYHDTGMPDTLVVARDVFCSHYINASLSVTALMRGAGSGPNYLVYLNRTELDVLHGVLAGLVKHSIEGRLKNATKVMTDLRERLESGDPPQNPPG
jgi:hypothetical protein